MPKERKERVSDEPQEAVETAPSEILIPEAPAPEAAASQERKENDRVKVRGRIGGDVVIRTTKEKGEPVANFSLAEHPDPNNSETTVWHNAAVFGDRAQQLQKHVDDGEIRKGMEVDVVGFLHFAERPRREGGMQTVEQIYVVSIKPVVKPTGAAPSSEAPSGPQGPQVPQGQ